jgi:hypothetical protein
MTHRYFAAPSAGFGDEDAETIGARITALATTGELTPERVVEDARPADSPTHRFFEWNDAAAAEKYRVGQAKHYMANIYVVRAEAREPIRADELLRLAPAERHAQGSRVVASVQREEDLVREAREELARWRERFDTCPPLRPAAILVREALETLEALAARRGAGALAMRKTA